MGCHITRGGGWERTCGSRCSGQGPHSRSPPPSPLLPLFHSLQNIFSLLNYFFVLISNFKPSRSTSANCNFSLFLFQLLFFLKILFDIYRYIPSIKFKKLIDLYAFFLLLFILFHNENLSISFVTTFLQNGK